LRERPVSGLGKHLRILDSGLSIKKYPMCYAAHRVIDAVLELRDGRKLDSGEIRFARGNAKLPLKEEELKAKFFDCAASADYLDAGALYQALNKLGEQASLRQLGASTATA
jgi:2-methylcitrate dehydratase PrpD